MCVDTPSPFCYSTCLPYYAGSTTGTISIRPGRFQISKMESTMTIFRWYACMAAPSAIHSAPCAGRWWPRDAATPACSAFCASCRRPSVSLQLPRWRATAITIEIMPEQRANDRPGRRSSISWPSSAPIPPTQASLGLSPARGCAGTGCGTLIQCHSMSVTYTAPGGLSAAISVTLTATSVAQTFEHADADHHRRSGAHVHHHDAAQRRKRSSLQSDDCGVRWRDALHVSKSPPAACRPA